MKNKRLNKLKRENKNNSKINEIKESNKTKKHYICNHKANKTKQQNIEIMEKVKMTKEEMITKIKKDYKNKFDRLAFIQDVKCVKATDRFSADSYTGKEIKERFEDIIKYDEEEVIEQAIQYECYKHIEITEEKRVQNKDAKKPAKNDILKQYAKELEIEIIKIEETKKEIYIKYKQTKDKDTTINKYRKKFPNERIGYTSYGKNENYITILKDKK